MATPLLGWIRPQDRTPAQHDAHAKALASFHRSLGLIGTAAPPKGVKILLTDLWKDPDVVADIGSAFTGFRQLTGSCFPAGTRITTYEGSIPIELLEVGRNVKTAEGNLGSITSVLRRAYDGPLIGIGFGFGVSLWATPEHPILTPNGYAPIKYLKKGDKVSYDGEVLWVTIRDLETKPFLGDVYNLEVEGDHSYIAEGVGVHNCVGVSTGNAVFTLSAVQRKLSASPTKAFIPWWPYAYGTCRANEGDSGQGEGAVDSVMAETLVKNGVLPYDQAHGLPVYDRSDGLAISSGEEMAYSDGRSSLNTTWASVAKQFPVGSCAVLNSTGDIANAIVNGYPVLDGCDQYVGNGSLQGDVALGEYDGNGGHSTCFLGYWDNKDLGPLFLYSNQWGGNTYPNDATGKGRCTVWMKESAVAQLFHLGGSGGETVALSHLTYFPAQPAVLDWSTL